MSDVPDLSIALRVRRNHRWISCLISDLEYISDQEVTSLAWAAQLLPMLKDAGWIHQPEAAAWFNPQWGTREDLT